MAKPSLVYPDACIFINVIKKEAGLWGESLKVLLAAERGDIRLAASTFLLAELNGWKGDVDQAERDDTVGRFLEGVNTTWSEVDFLTVRVATDLSERYHLRGADAVHLATAIRLGCDYFMTRDTDFPRGTEIDGVKIRRPSIVWDPTVDDVLVDSEADAEVEQQDKQPARAASRISAEGKRLIARKKPLALEPGTSEPTT